MDGHTYKLINVSVSVYDPCEIAIASLVSSLVTKRYNEQLAWPLRTLKLSGHGCYNVATINSS